MKPERRTQRETNLIVTSFVRKSESAQPPSSFPSVKTRVTV